MVLWRWKWFLNVWSAWLPMRMPFICNFHLNSLKPEIHLKLGKINLPIEKLKWSKNLNISWQYIKIDVVFAQFYISCGQWTSSFSFFGETVCSLQLFTQTCQFYAIAGRSQLGGKFTSTKFNFFKLGADDCEVFFYLPTVEVAMGKLEADEKVLCIFKCWIIIGT